MNNDEYRGFKRYEAALIFLLSIAWSVVSIAVVAIHGGPAA